MIMHFAVITQMKMSSYVCTVYILTIILGLVSWEKIVSRYRRPVYRDIAIAEGVGRQATAQPSGETRTLALMTAAVSVGRFQPETLWMT